MEDQGLEERVNSIADLAEVIKVIERYREIIQIQNKKVIDFVRKQGQWLKNKKQKDNKNLFQLVCQSKFTIYLKMNLHKLLKKYPVLKNFILFSNYFKNNLKLIEMVCKTNVNLFTKNRRQMLCIAIVL